MGQSVRVDRVLCRLLAFASIFLFIWNAFVITTVVICQKARQDASVLFTAPTIPFSSLSTGRALFLCYFLSHTAMCIYCHLRVWNSDPGYVKKLIPKSVTEMPKDPPICKKCDVVWKPPRAHHCRLCDKCIFRMDHHCPWVNNCVGYSNFKLFVIFLVYSLFLSGVGAALVVGQLLHWLISVPYYQTPVPSPITIFLLVLTAACSIFFVISFKIFLGDQITAAELNSSLIESYKMSCGRNMLFKDALEELFGTNWLTYGLPIQPKLRVDLNDPVFCPEDFEEPELYRNENEFVMTSNLSDDATIPLKPRHLPIPTRKALRED